jgi:hypothetical protein
MLFVLLVGARAVLREHRSLFSLSGRPGPIMAAGPSIAAEAPVTGSDIRARGAGSER